MLLAPPIRGEYMARWNDIRRQEEELDDAILIGLVGGTGVGKSTFVNALAGSVISRSSDRRPTTSRVIVYRYVETELPSDVPTAHLSQPQVLHQHSDLSKVILFDFPDFDSAELSHRDIVADYLPHLDIVFVVVDDIKYGDRRLYDLLRSLEHDRSNMFVLLNKVDRLVERYGPDADRVIAEMRSDLKDKLVEFAGLALDESQIFPISAWSIFLARTEHKASVNAAEFNEVEALLRRFEAEKHRRAAKEKNLDVRKSELALEIRRTALSDDNRAVIRDSQQLVTKWRSEVTQASSAISVDVLGDREHRALQKKRIRRARMRWGQPVAVLLTLLSELGRWRGERISAESIDLPARLYQHYRGFFESLGNLKARVESEIAGTSLAQPAIAPKSETRDLVESADSLTARLGQAFAHRLSEGDHRSRRLARWLTHLPALGVLGMALWSCVYPVLDSAFGSSERGFFSALVRSVIGSLSPSFLIFVALAVLLAYLLSAVAVWVREVQRLEAEVADAERMAHDEILEHGSRVVSDIDQRVQSLHHEFGQLEQLLG